METDDNVYDPERYVPPIVKAFVIAIRRLSMRDTTGAGTSRNSRITLILLLESGLKNKENRVAVLQALTGLPIATQNNLTQASTSALIDQLIGEMNGEKPCLTRESRSVIRITEGLVEDGVVRYPWLLYPWDAPESAFMSTMQ